MYHGINRRSRAIDKNKHRINYIYIYIYIYQNYPFLIQVIFLNNVFIVTKFIN
jgi:hypothetical protein